MTGHRKRRAGPKRGIAVQKVGVTPQLAGLLGSSRPITRTRAVKRFWGHVKGNGLLKKKGMIAPDSTLRPILGKNRVHMTEATRLLFQNFTS